MFHIKAPVLLITTAEPKNIKLFFFYVCNRFRMGSQIQYLLLFGIIPRPPSASCFLPDFILFNFVFSPTLQKSGHFLSQHIYTHRRDMIVPGTYCVSFFFVSVGVSPCVWLPRGRMQSADANFVICLDWAVADGASGRLRHRCFRAGWGAHERQALSPCGQRVSTRM